MALSKPQEVLQKPETLSGLLSGEQKANLSVSISKKFLFSTYVKAGKLLKIKKEDCPAFTQVIGQAVLVFCPKTFCRLHNRRRCHLGKVVGFEDVAVVVLLLITSVNSWSGWFEAREKEAHPIFSCLGGGGEAN